MNLFILLNVDMFSVCNFDLTISRILLTFSPLLHSLAWCQIIRHHFLIVVRSNYRYLVSDVHTHFVYALCAIIVLFSIT